MTLGEVPTSVMRPPSSEAKAIGIRNTEGETPERLAIWKAIGIIMASAPMFFTKADSTVTMATRTSSCVRGAEMSGPKRAAPLP